MKQPADILRQALDLQNRGDLAQAEKLYNEVISANPRHFDALHLLGLLSYQRGDSRRALELIGAALNVNPDSATALLNQGSILCALSRYEEALPCFDGALAINPSLYFAIANRGKALIELKRYEEALASLERALALKPADRQTLFNYGFALRQMRRYPEALNYFDKVLALDTNDAWTLFNRAQVLRQLRRYQEAIASHRRILKVRSQDPSLLDRCGRELIWLGAINDALLAFQQVLEIVPENAEAKWEIALIHLALGDFTKGWAGYESRWKIKHPPSESRHTTLPLWNGEKVAGRLLVWGEQGLGDEILYGAMVPELLPYAAAITAEVEPRLAPLFARSFPNVEVIGRGDPIPSDTIAQSPFPSLGRYLRPNREAFPKRSTGYLLADAQRAAGLRRRLSPHGETVIGISWVSKNPVMGESKTAQLTDFEPLLRLPGARYVDLQYGDTSEEREALRQKTGIAVERLEDIDNTNDLDGLAALIAACDVVVTVSNTTAHLAGALGKPTVVFVPYGKGRIWYWFTEGDDSPWYPRLRLKRQQQGQPWKELAASAAGEIAALAKDGVKQPA